MKNNKLWIAMMVILIVIGQKKVNGQAVESVLASIDYEFVHVNDTNNRDKPQKTNMRVYLGQESSHYVNQSVAEMMEKMEARLREMNVSISGGTAKIQISRAGKGSGSEELFLFPADRKLIVIDQIASTEYLIEQNYPQLEWEIGEETKEIGGFHVQQAKTHFGGRNYTVWFTPDLPFAFGPWKLHGLPGLILEAHDDTNEVQFNFKDFGRLEAGDRKIALPEKGVKASPSQFARAKEAYDRNPTAARQSNVPAGAVIERREVVVINDEGGNRRTLTGDEAKQELERRRLQETNSNNNPVEKEIKKKN